MSDALNDTASPVTTGPADGAVNAEGGAPSQPQRETETPKSKGSKLSARDDVKAAFDEIAAKPGDGDAKPAKAKGDEAKPDGADKATTQKPQGSEPARGPDGKFAKADQQQAAATAQEPGAAAQQPQPINAPPSWKGSQKVDWNRLPRPVQEGIAAEFERFAQLEQQYSPINAVLGPRLTALQAQYGGVPQALQQLFALSDYADRDPAGFINWFAQQRRINVQQPVNPGSQQGQQHAGQQAHDAASIAGIDPSLKPLVDELNGIKRFLSQQQTAAQQHEQAATREVQQQAHSEVQAFIANSKEFPYANDLREEMAAIFASGQAKTLKDAYEAAAWRVPAVRDRMIADRTQTELDRQAKAAAEKKNAGVSVSGSPGGQAAGAANRKATARDDVIAAAREIGFGGSSRL